jgi:hypothetical protein
MREHVKTWKAIAGAWATLWREFAKLAEPDPSLARIMRRVAENLEDLDAYLATRVDGDGG